MGSRLSFFSFLLHLFRRFQKPTLSPLSLFDYYLSTYLIEERRLDGVHALDRDARDLGPLFYFLASFFFFFFFLKRKREKGCVVSAGGRFSSSDELSHFFFWFRIVVAAP